MDKIATTVDSAVPREVPPLPAGGGEPPLPAVAGLPRLFSTQCALDRAREFEAGRLPRRRDTLAAQLADASKEQLVAFALACADYADKFDIVNELQAAEAQVLAEEIKVCARDIKNRSMRKVVAKRLADTASRNFENTIAPPMFPAILPASTINEPMET